MQFVRFISNQSLFVKNLCFISFNSINLQIHTPKLFFDSSLAACGGTVDQVFFFLSLLRNLMHQTLNSAMFSKRIYCRTSFEGLWVWQAYLLSPLPCFLISLLNNIWFIQGLNFHSAPFRNSRNKTNRFSRIHVRI